MADIAMKGTHSLSSAFQEKRLRQKIREKLADHHQVLTAHSEPNIEMWNSNEMTLFDDIAELDLPDELHRLHRHEAN